MKKEEGKLYTITITGYNLTNEELLELIAKYNNVLIEYEKSTL